MKTAYLVTGSPGVGKTTLIRQVVSTMRMRAAGFYTEDLRSSGTREGFRLVTLDGDVGLLAAAGRPDPIQVSKYGVNMEVLEELGVKAIQEALDRNSVLVVDEIGKMELFSRAFRQTVLKAIREGHLVLGTIMQGRNPYADRIKAQPNVALLTLTPGNRQEVLQLLRSKFV